MLASGKRNDVLVQGGSPGTFPLQGLTYQPECAVCAVTLATVTVAGPALSPAALPTSLVTPARLSSADVVRRRTLIFAGDDPRQEYTIISALFDATLFDAARVAQLVRLGDVEESIPGLAGRQSSDSSGPPHAEGDEG